MNNSVEAFERIVREQSTSDDLDDVLVLTVNDEPICYVRLWADAEGRHVDGSMAHGPDELPDFDFETTHLARAVLTVEIHRKKTGERSTFTGRTRRVVTQTCECGRSTVDFRISECVVQ